MLFLQENCWVEANDWPSKVGLYSVFIAVLRLFLESINTKWAPQLQGLLLDRSIFCPHPVLTWQQLRPPQQKLLHRMEGVLRSPRHPVFTQWLKKPHAGLLKASSERDWMKGEGGPNIMQSALDVDVSGGKPAVQALLFILAPLTRQLCFKCVFFFHWGCFGLRNQLSHQSPISLSHVKKVSFTFYMSRLFTSTEPGCLVFFSPHPPNHFTHDISHYSFSEVCLNWSLCLHSVLAGLHPVFYELWKDIKVADTSIRWCQLSVAVTGLLHLSHGRGEVWPQATGGSGEPAPTSHFSLQYDSEALSRRTKLLNEAIGFW